MVALKKTTSLQVVARLVLYTILVVLSAQMIRLDASLIVDGRKFVETSYTEWSQGVYILLTALAFIFIGKRFDLLRPVSYLLGGGFVVVLIREMDACLDVIYHGAWLPVALVTLAATLYSVYRHRSIFKKSLECFVSTPALGLLVAGGLSVFVFSRLFGAKAIWAAVFAVEVLEPRSPARWVKNAVEEGCELFGYTLVFCASIELWSYANRHLKPTSSKN